MLKHSEEAHGEEPAGSIDSAESVRASHKLKFVLFSLVLAMAFIVVLEVAVRASGMDQPRLKTPFIPVLDAGFRTAHRNDDELFYSLRPNFEGQFWTTPITTNSLGLRNPEIGPKTPNEFRILCLGESTTFGAGVQDDETYSARLQDILSTTDETHRYTVINAGVSAYSSFQSAQYLELRGVHLRPDMVIIYHELADFLPTTNRENLTHDVRGLPLSDKQLYESHQRSVSRKLLKVSALYRLFAQVLTQWRLDTLQKDGAVPEAEHVVIPEQLNQISTPEGVKALQLPPRVPLDERRENLDRMRTVCERIGAEFVVIHPSYGESKRHECDLTEYCRRNNVPMFEAYDSLHPEGATMEEMYVDLWHPNAIGHANLARDLFEFLLSEKLLPIVR